MAVTKVNLTQLGTEAGTAIDASDTSLVAQLANMGADASAADLLKIQIEITKNSVITSAWSGLVKERSDTLKGVVQKF